MGGLDIRVLIAGQESSVCVETFLIWVELLQMRLPLEIAGCLKRYAQQLISALFRNSKHILIEVQ